MTDKHIIIDYENLCENYSKEVGCYNTFDGSCIKEQCFTYRLLQLLKTKEQECNKYKQTITEIEEIAMCIMDDDLEESSAYYNAKQILQKIRECEVENKN